MLGYERALAALHTEQKRAARRLAKDRRDNPIKYRNPAKRRLIQLCDQCDRRFRIDARFDSSRPKLNQALDNCASNILFCPILGRWYVLNGYPSIYDNDTFEVAHPTQMPHALEHHQLICDFCIKDLLSTGVLQRVIQDGRWIGDLEWKDEYLIIRHAFWETMALKSPEYIYKWFGDRTLDELVIRRPV